MHGKKNKNTGNTQKWARITEEESATRETQSYDNSNHQRPIGSVPNHVHRQIGRKILGRCAGFGIAEGLWRISKDCTGIPCTYINKNRAGFLKVVWMHWANAHAMWCSSKPYAIMLICSGNSGNDYRTHRLPARLIIVTPIPPEVVLVVIRLSCDAIFVTCRHINAIVVYFSSRSLMISLSIRLRTFGITVFIGYEQITYK